MELSSGTVRRSLGWQLPNNTARSWWLQPLWLRRVCCSGRHLGVIETALACSFCRAQKIRSPRWSLSSDVGVSASKLPVSMHGPKPVAVSRLQRNLFFSSSPSPPSHPSSYILIFFKFRISPFIKFPQRGHSRFFLSLSLATPPAIKSSPPGPKPFLRACPCPFCPRERKNIARMDSLLSFQPAFFFFFCASSST